jgi:hypothetical protein
MAFSRKSQTTYFLPRYNARDSGRLSPYLSLKQAQIKNPVARAGFIEANLSSRWAYLAAMPTPNIFWHWGYV